MGALDALLRYKQQKDAEATADVSAIPQALMLYQQGKQQALDNTLKTLTLQGTLAKSGIGIGPNNQLVPDTRFEDPLTQLKAQKYKTDALLAETRMNYLNQKPGMDLAKEQKREVNQSANRSSGLRKEFNSLPAVKDYQVIKNQISSMDSLLEASKNDNESRMSLDQGLITLFNKITDPRSVVRESEYARTPENLSLANRLTGAVEKLKKGGAGLTQEDRKALVFGAKLIGNQYGKTYNSLVDNYTQIASNPKMNVDPDLVIGGLGKHSDFFGKTNSDSGSSKGSKKVGKFKIVSVQ